MVKVRWEQCGQTKTVIAESAGRVEVVDAVGGTDEGAIAAGLLNPLVWLGIILGFYWIIRSGDAEVFRCPRYNKKCRTHYIEPHFTEAVPNNQRRCSQCETVFAFKN